jgi:hypothetical protein
MRSSFFSTVSDGFAEARPMLVGFGLTCAVLLGLFANEVWTWSYPYRTARAAVREVLADPSAQVGETRIIRSPRLGPYYYGNHRLVCGVLRNDRRPFAVLVRHRHRASLLGLGSSIPGVRAVALANDPATDRLGAAMLDACL